MPSAPDQPDGTAVTSRERLDFLLDEGWKSLSGNPALPIAEGRIDGRPVLAAALAGGPTLQAEHLESLAALMQRAVEEGWPVLLVLGRHTLSSDPATLAALLRIVQAFAAGPTGAMTAVAALGAVVGPLALVARMAGVVIAGPAGQLALASSEVVEATLGIAASAAPDGLDGEYESDAAALLALRRIACLLPQRSGVRWRQIDPDNRPDASLDRLIGTDLDAAFDVRWLFSRIVDDRDWFELEADHGEAIVTGLAWLGGVATMLIASNSAARSGALDVSALHKALRQVERASRLRSPLLFVLDTPGVLPEPGAQDAVVRLATGLANATIPVLTLVARRLIGSAALLAAAPAPTRRTLHWPSARIGLTRASARGPDGAILVPPSYTREAVIVALRDLAPGGCR